MAGRYAWAAGVMLLIAVLAAGYCWFSLRESQHFAEPVAERRQADFAARLAGGALLHGQDEAGALRRFHPGDLLSQRSGACYRSVPQPGTGNGPARKLQGVVVIDCIEHLEVAGIGPLRLVMSYRFDAGMRDPLQVRGVNGFGPAVQGALAQDRGRN